MKKTLKSIIGAVLAMLIALSGVSAFAAGDTITWKYEDYSEEYTYGGEFSEGENKIAPRLTGEDEEYIYYEFNAEKSGCYLVTCKSEDNFLFNVAEKFENGSAFGTCDYAFVENEDSSARSRICYFDEGTNIFGVVYQTHDDAYDYDDCTVEIEFYGEEITDIVFADDSVFEIVTDFDYENKAGDIWYINLDATVYFSSGKTLEYNDYYFSFVLNEDAEEGENAVTLSFVGYEEEATVAAYSIEHYIESIEISNLEKYTVVHKDYKGESYFSHPEGETLTVKYTDSTTEEYEYNYGSVIEICGRYCFTDGWFESDGNGGYTYNVNIAGKNYISVPCTVENLGIRENYEEMTEDLKWNFHYDIRIAKNLLAEAFDLGNGLAAGERLACVKDALVRITDAVKSTLNYIGLFAGYYCALPF